MESLKQTRKRETASVHRIMIKAKPAADCPVGNTELKLFTMDAIWETICDGSLFHPTIPGFSTLCSLLSVFFHLGQKTNKHTEASSVSKRHYSKLNWKQGGDFFFLHSISVRMKSQLRCLSRWILNRTSPSCICLSVSRKSLYRF